MLRRIIISLLLCGAAAWPGWAQSLNPVSVSATLAPAQVKPGGKARLLIQLKLEPGWHVYAMTQKAPPHALKIVLAAGDVFKADGGAQQPKPLVAFDPNFEMNTETFVQAVTITQPVQVAANAAAGAYKLPVKVIYQACNEQICLPSKTVALSVETTISAASAGTKKRK